MFLLTLAATGIGAAGLGWFAAGRLTQPPPAGPSTEPGRGRRIRSARLATSFDGAAGSPAWSPEGDAICVQHARAGARFVAVYDAGDWKMRFAERGSLPVWAPDGVAIASIDPFPTTIPVPADNRVRVLDARTGAELRTFETRTASIGWGRDGIRAAVAGELLRLESPAPLPQSCGGACGVVLWSFDAQYAATSDLRSESGRYEVREASTGRLVADLGPARSAVAWASASPTLVGAFEQGPLAWRPRGIERLAFVPGEAPVASSPDGEVVIAVAAGAERLLWTQWRRGDPQPESVDLPLQSVRGVTWAPGGRYLTSIPQTFGPSARLEVFEVDLET